VLFTRAAHPYTQALLSVVPVPDPRQKRRRTLVSGEIPSPLAPPSGCRFHTRCPHAEAICRIVEPLLIDLGSGQSVACHLHAPATAKDHLHKEALP
jgi:oligopeptide/dipeptide ABC transporter ATP-binding protein